MPEGRNPWMLLTFSILYRIQRRHCLVELMLWMSCKLILIQIIVIASQKLFLFYLFFLIDQWVSYSYIEFYFHRVHGYLGMSICTFLAFYFSFTEKRQFLLLLCAMTEKKSLGMLPFLIIQIQMLIQPHGKLGFKRLMEISQAMH